MTEKKPLVVIAGPTASGKTSLAIALAHRFHAEIVSADSMQVYRHMDIGTAKPTHDEMQGIPHYMIDEADPDEAFSVAKYKELAAMYIRRIHEKGKLPILVGGTGFYIRAVLRDNCFTQTETDEALRQELYGEAKNRGNLYVHNRLARIDPESAAVIHPNNLKRVIRAIEFHAQTGETISAHNRREQSKADCYTTAFFALDVARDVLYERINRRVDDMIAMGLEQEVRGLSRLGYGRDLVSMQGLGYKEMIRYLAGETGFEEAICDIKAGTRHYAKRQITWFTHQCEAIWIHVDESHNTGIMNEDSLLCNAIRQII